MSSSCASSTRASVDASAISDVVGDCTVSGVVVFLRPNVVVEVVVRVSIVSNLSLVRISFRGAVVVFVIKSFSFTVDVVSSSYFNLRAHGTSEVQRFIPLK